MPTAETGLSKKCMAKLPPKYFGERIENSSGNGTADLVISHRNIESWIELKCASKPRALNGFVNLKHIRKGQVQWHRRKKRAGCQTWFLIQIGSGLKATYIAIKGLWSQDLRDGMTLDEIKGACAKWCTDLRTILQFIADEDWAYARA